MRFVFRRKCRGVIFGSRQQFAGWRTRNARRRLRLPTNSRRLPFASRWHACWSSTQAGRPVCRWLLAKRLQRGRDRYGFAFRIPGTIGGSLRMNAGTDREIGDFVRAKFGCNRPVVPQPHRCQRAIFLSASTLAPVRSSSRVTLRSSKWRIALTVRAEMQSTAGRSVKIRSRSLFPTPARVSAILLAIKRRAHRISRGLRDGAKAMRKFRHCTRTSSTTLGCDAQGRRYVARASTIGGAGSIQRRIPIGSPLVGVFIYER